MYDDDTEKGPPYVVREIFDRNAGQPKLCILGPGLSIDPLLSGSFQSYDKKDAVECKVICSMLNNAYQLGKDSFREELREKLDEIYEMFPFI